MELLKIEATNNTPEIELNAQSAIFTIRGDSYPENSFSFYQPVMTWIENFIASQPASILIKLELIYFNSSTSKILYDLFDLLNDAQEEGVEIKVNWYYDQKNYAAQESAEEFQEDYETLTFNLVAL